MSHGTVSDTHVELLDTVAPGDLNLYGTLFGGKLLSLIDKCAGFSAFKHAKTGVVTISIDQVDFYLPVEQGALLTIRSSVNRSFKSSMEVGVCVWMQNMKKGIVEPVRICRAYTTFVALDENGEKVVLPQIIPETPEEISRWNAAALRRQRRIELREQLDRARSNC